MQPDYAAPRLPSCYGGCGDDAQRWTDIHSWEATMNTRIAVGVLILVVFAIGSAPAASAAVAAKPLDPSALVKRIAERGAVAVYGEVRGDEQWEAVLTGIESGNRDWLRFAVAIHPATDGGYSEMLSWAAGVALLKAPANVLEIAGPDLPLESVCGYPDMGDARTDTQAKVVSYLDSRTRAVEKLHVDALASKRDRCLAELARTRTDVSGSHGPFSK